MLGSEYNWLVSLTQTAGGVPKVTLAKSGLFTLAVAVFCFLCIALHAEPVFAGLPEQTIAPLPVTPVSAGTTEFSFPS